MATNPFSQNPSIAQMDHEELGGALLTQLMCLIRLNTHFKHCLVISKKTDSEWFNPVL